MSGDSAKNKPLAQKRTSPIKPGTTEKRARPLQEEKLEKPNGILQLIWQKQSELLDDLIYKYPMDTLIFISTLTGGMLVGVSRILSKHAAKLRDLKTRVDDQTQRELHLTRFFAQYECQIESLVKTTQTLEGMMDKKIAEAKTEKQLEEAKDQNELLRTVSNMILSQFSNVPLEKINLPETEDEFNVSWRELEDKVKGIKMPSDPIQKTPLVRHPGPTSQLQSSKATPMFRASSQDKMTKLLTDLKPVVRGILLTIRKR